MARQLDVIGIGHVTCDIICPVQGWPKRDTKTIIPTLTLAGGGPTANALAAAARLGLNTGLVGRLGDDVLGRFTWEAHRAEGIDVSRLDLDPLATSPVSVIISDLADSTRTILLTKGDHTALNPELLDWEWIWNSRLIHLDGHQMPASLAVAREARNRPEVMVMLDAGSMREGMVELCELCEIVIASQRFARELTGTDSPDGCLSRLKAMGVRIAGVTLGAEGSICRDENGTIHLPAFPVPVRDTTGAGDAYHGGFIYGLLSGNSLSDCMRIASAVAALKCTGNGARQTLPDAELLSKFLKNT
jgi:sulfofructose kinase